MCHTERVKLITWNVNSLRMRHDRLLALLERHRPDVVCLQETKVQDEAFPFETIEAAGYHSAAFGQRGGYNGVAILSRESLSDVSRGFDGDPVPQEARVVSAVTCGVKVICAYVVNGQSLDSDKYQTKLTWLTALTNWISKKTSPDDAVLLAGDFNIAPDDRDVYDPQIWHDRVLCSIPERQRYEQLIAWGMVDLLRRVSDEPLFSWWDYRHGAFHRNLGLRIDLVLGTEQMAQRCKAVEVDREERKQSTGPGKPSDHAPVIATFDEKLE